METINLEPLHALETGLEEKFRVLLEMATDNTGHRAAHLYSKAEGVNLALSFVRESIRGAQ